MTLSDISIKRPVFTAVMMLALVVFGVSSYSRVGIDLFPDVDFPVATVQAVYPGADPATIETKVVDKLEESINQVNGIDELRSTSSENLGLVTVQFELARDTDKAVQDVRDKVAAVVGDLPEDVEKPIVQKFDIGAAPIMSMVVSGPYSTRHLTRLSDDTIKERLQTLPGVGNITIVGGQDREFHVMINPVQLESFGLAVGDVSRAVASQNLDVPGGRIEQGNTEFTVKTEGEVHNAQDLSDLVISHLGGRSVRIGDVAEVIDGQEEKRSHASLNGESAVSLTIKKQSGANTVAVAKAVHAEIDEMRGDLADDITIRTPVDNSTFIEESIHDVQFDLAFGALLAVIIILIFLRDWRATLISALALPTSVIATVAFINVMGFTFNTLTMLALTLSIGILIDDAIVVIENIHRHLEMGKSPYAAAREATAEIGLAVMAITASIVAVFVPVATMKGIMGRFFYQFGLTVAFAVSVSLFVALTLTPMLSARLLKTHDDPSAVGRFMDRLLGGLDSLYHGLIQRALRHPFVTMLVAVVAFAGSLSLFKIIPVEFIPAADRGEFRVYADLPTGTALDQTMDTIEDMTADLRDMPGVELTFATIGGGAKEQVDRATVHVEMVDEDRRSFSQQDAMKYARTMLAKYNDVEVAVSDISAVGGGGSERRADVQYLVMGPDYDQLNETADKMIDALEAHDGYVDVDKSTDAGKPELRVNIDRERAADLNVPVAAIGTAIRTLYAGEKVSEVSTDGDRFDARVRMLERFRDNPAKLLDLSVRSSTGALVPLSNIVDISTGAGPSQIERFNRRRQVTVMANLEDKALGTANKEINEIFDKIAPDTVRGQLTGGGDNLKESLGYMVEALVLAIVLIFLILSAQFESFMQPLTIMLSLPLSLIGALGALALTGMSLNMFTMIGFIMLMGLVVKNAVLLVDYTNVLQDEQDMGRFDALVEAGTVRLRPILMTTLAMIFGMLPVAMALSAGGESRAPMAVAIIGGLITSTMLTLVVIPVAYLLTEALKDRVLPSRRRGDDDAAAQKGRDGTTAPASW